MHDKIMCWIELAIQELQECDQNQLPIHVTGQIFYARNLLDKALFLLDRETSMIPAALDATGDDGS